jgi:hypothetical protein
MKKIEKLTPEQEAKLSVYRDKWLNRFFNYEFYNAHDFEKTEAAMKKLYKFCDLKEPKVLLLDSPMACQIEVNRLKNNTKDNMVFEQFSSYINYTDFGWLSFYDFFVNECGLIQNHKENLEMFNECVSCSFMQIQLEELCVVSKYPNLIKRNATNDLHSTTGHAIEFADGYGQHYVNGRFIEPEIFAECSNIENAKICFHTQSNEDIKACIITIIKENFGNEGLLEMLNAKLIDEKTIDHTENYSEIIRIYHSKDKHSFLQNSKGELDQPYAWIEMTCPSTGNVYLIDTCPTFTDAVECAKWHRPELVPSDLVYKWRSAN